MSAANTAGTAAAAGAGPQGKTYQQLKLNSALATAAQGAGLQPTALHTRVLARTTADFADVIVDGRCANGTNAAGTAASIWIYFNNNPSAAAAAAAGLDPTASGAPPPPYLSKAAVQERQMLLLLYAAHCVLTCSSSVASSSGPVSGGGGNGGRAPAHFRSPEIALVVASSQESAVQMREAMLPVAKGCGLEVVVVPAGMAPPELAVSAAATPTSSTPAATASPSSPTPPPEAAGKTSPPPAKDGAKGSEAGATGTPYHTTGVGNQGTIIILTLSTLTKWDIAQFLSTSISIDGTRSLPLHVAALVAEDVGVLRSQEDINAWDAMIVEVHNAVGKHHPRFIPSLHFSPHFMWVCMGPLVCLALGVRLRLSRRCRRFYPLLPSGYVPTAAQSLAPTMPGISFPLESTRMVYLFALDEKDKEEQVKVILSRTKTFQRVILLTHNKDIRHLNTAVISWGTYGKSEDTAESRSKEASGETPSGGCELSTLAKLTAASTRAGDNRQLFMQRTDPPEKQAALQVAFMDCIDTASQNEQPVLLLSWDAFTGADMMDVDVLIQLHPPQKSLAEKEWAEYIQVLHSTGDAEMDIEASLRANPNNTDQNIRAKMVQLLTGITTNTPMEGRVLLRRRSRPPTIITFLGSSDFSLAAHFMQQYQYSGGTGMLTPAALAASLSAVAAVGGNVGPSANSAQVPVLNISPTHPLFIPLVCGEEAKVNAAGEGPAGMDEAVTVKNVLKAKLKKEKEAKNGTLGKDGNPPNYVLPCFIPHHHHTNGTPPLGSGSASPVAASAITPASGPTINVSQGGVGLRAVATSSTAMPTASGRVTSPGSLPPTFTTGANGNSVSGGGSAGPTVHVMATTAASTEKPVSSPSQSQQSIQSSSLGRLPSPSSSPVANKQAGDKAPGTATTTTTAMTEGSGAGHGSGAHQGGAGGRGSGGGGGGVVKGTTAGSGGREKDSLAATGASSSGSPSTSPVTSPATITKESAPMAAASGSVSGTGGGGGAAGTGTGEKTSRRRSRGGKGKKDKNKEADKGSGGAGGNGGGDRGGGGSAGGSRGGNAVPGATGGGGSAPVAATAPPIGAPKSSTVVEDLLEKIGIKARIETRL